jgi:hypothetical protein
VVAANRVAAISKEATSRADDKSDFLGVFGRRGAYSRRYVCRVPTPSVQIILQPPRSQRAILFL